MIQLIKNTKRDHLEGVYFEDIDDLVSSKDKAWLLPFLRKYFSTEKAATDWCEARGLSTSIVK